jgi:uncharacterized membrane protein YhaH (DUF805 family)
MGLDVFWDNEIPPGQTWADYIESKLTACKVVIVLWSANSTKSQWVREEARMGRDRAKLIPVMIDGSAAPFGFGEVQAGDLSGWNGEASHGGWQRFSQAVYAAVNGSATPAPPAAAAPAYAPPPALQPANAPPPHSAAATVQSSPIGYIMKCLRLYAEGKGRARRSEYGWFFAFLFVVTFVAGFLDALLFGIDPYTGMANTYILTLIATFGLIVPAVAAASRRAHDFGQSGWLAALTVIPYLGILAALAFIFIPGQSGANAHGPDPKAG